MRLLLALLIACSSKREAPPEPPPPSRPVIHRPDIAPGTILRERKLGDFAGSLVVTANAIYYASVRTGVFMLRDDTPTELDREFSERLSSDGEAIYFVTIRGDKRRLVRHPFGGESTELDQPNGDRVQAVDATHVYVTHDDKAALKIPKTGGASLTLPCKRRFAVDDAALYCLEGNQLVRYDKQGQGRTVLANVLGFPIIGYQPVVTDRFVYVPVVAVDPAGFHLVRIAKDGSKPLEIVARNVGVIYDIVAVDGREVWWAETPPATSMRKVIVRHIADDETKPTDFADGFARVRSIVVTPSTVFIADDDPPRIVELAR